MNDISYSLFQYYPYHLTWEELNNPGSVLEKFFENWDLQECRLLLKKWNNLVLSAEKNTSSEEYKNLKHFIDELEKLIEAIYLIRVKSEYNELK